MTVATDADIVEEALHRFACGSGDNTVDEAREALARLESKARRFDVIYELGAALELLKTITERES